MDSRLSIGLAQFNAGRFVVAHELWEALWNETIGPGKALLRGLVQIAAGYAKVESGLSSGALKLLTRGVEQVRPFLPASLGLDLVGLVDGVTADIARLRAAPEDERSLDAVRPPQLQLL
jgi:predicted metal-dependent hydrolase